jgi:hypothetical protein
MLFTLVPNGVRYQRLERRKLGNGNPPKLRTMPENAQSPSRPVHYPGDSPGRGVRQRVHIHAIKVRPTVFTPSPIP